MRRIRLCTAIGVAFLMGFPLAEQAKAQAGDFVYTTLGFSLAQLILGISAQS